MIKEKRSIRRRFKLDIWLIGIFITLLFITEITALQIGGRTTSFFNGTLDEVAIYNRTLTAAEIMEHYLFNNTKTTQDIKASVNQSWDIDNDNISIAYRWYKNKVLNASTIHNETNLVLYMPFDNDALDYALDNNGTLQNSTHGNITLISNGKIAGAYEFDGDGDYIKIPHSQSLNITGNLTIEAWVKPRIINQYQPVISKGYRYNYELTVDTRTASNNALAWRQGNGSHIDSINFTNFFTDGETWYHVVAVRDSTNITVYKNGEYFNSSEISINATSISFNITIGKRANESYYFNGTIDELAIYNRTLTKEEIKQHYTAGRWGGYRIDDSYTLTGENWTIETRVVDFNHWGQAYNSSAIVIPDAPTTLTVVVNSSPTNANTTNETLWCYNTSQSVTQSIAVIITYAWYNNSILTDFTNQSIGSGNTTKGQNWTCEIKAVADATETRVNSTTLTILNALPDVETPVLNATDYPLNRTEANLTCYNISQGDVDDDALTTTYAWYNNTILTDIAADFVHSDNTTKYQNWTCEISVNDGEDTVRVNSTNLTIEDTPSSLTVVINSSPTNANTTNESLWCYNTSQSDPDGSTISYAWYNNTILTDFVDQSIGYKNTTKWQNWTCEINISDGSVQTRFNSTNLTILNSEPFFNTTIPNITENTGVAWSYPAFNVTDVDGDTLTYTINDSRITLDPPSINDTAIVVDIGTHYINISVSDGEANVSYIFTYAVGDLYPTWSNNQTNASNALKKNGSVQLNITLEDTFGLSWYIFAWNDTGELKNISNESISGKSFKIILNKTITRKGMHAWQVTFNDTASQWNQTPMFMFDVYNTLPAVPNVSHPANNSYMQQVDINYSSTDVDDEDAINYTIFINDTFNISTRNNIINLTMNDGFYRLKVSAYDQINYSDNSTEIIFTKDSTKPVITLEEPGDGALIESESVMFKYNVSDLSRVQNCSLFVSGSLEASTNSTIRFVSQNFTKGFGDADYTWNINCTDLANNTGNSSIYSFTVKIVIPAGPGEAAGGVGGAVTPREELIEYEVSEESIEAELKLGKAETRQLTIENTGSTQIGVVLYPKHLSDYVFIDETVFSLDINEKKTITLNIVGKDLGAHTGSLVVSASGIRRLIPMVISVGSDKTLFDVKIDIPSDYKEISPGEDLKAQITLFNIVGGIVDVAVNYIVKDMDGNIVLDESEVFAVEEQKSYLKTYKTSELEPGNYVALIEVRYADSFAVSSEMFSIKGEEITALAPKETRYTLIYTLLAIVMLFMTYLLVRLVLKKKK